MIDIAQDIDGWIFSHAGFTHFWVNSMKECLHHALDKWPEEDDGKPLRWDESEFSIKFLNDYWHTLEHWPGTKNSNYEFDELLDWHGYFSGSGNEITQGPFWVRPESLLKDAEYPKQIVGHTEYGFLEPLYLDENEHKIIVTDSPEHTNIFIFDTENPGEKWYTVDKFNKELKKTRHIILDAKSQHKDMSIPKKYLMENCGYSEQKAENAINYFSKD